MNMRILYMMYKHSKQALSSKLRVERTKLQHSTVPLPQREQPSMKVIGEFFLISSAGAK